MPQVSEVGRGTSAMTQSFTAFGGIPFAIFGGTFPQMPYLSRLLGIQEHVQDHDRHHQLLNVNYSKRFVLWDDVFGTRFDPRTHKETCD